MRFTKVSLAGLVVAGVAGCTNSASTPPASSAASHAAVAAQTAPAEPNAQAGARTATLRFDRQYLAGHYAAVWDLLVPAVRRQIPRGLWVKVHQGCQSTATTAARTVKTVTVFGNAAIVTETVTAGRPEHRRGEEVFSYVKGRWGYSPNDMSIYHRGSAAADIAAARAAGLCASWKSF
jgi:hypothetical protein